MRCWVLNCAISWHQKIVIHCTQGLLSKEICILSKIRFLYVIYLFLMLLDNIKLWLLLKLFLVISQLLITDSYSYWWLDLFVWFIFKVRIPLNILLAFTNIRNLRIFNVDQTAVGAQSFIEVQRLKPNNR